MTVTFESRSVFHFSTAVRESLLVTSKRRKAPTESYKKCSNSYEASHRHCYKILHSPGFAVIHFLCYFGNCGLKPYLAPFSLIHFMCSEKHSTKVTVSLHEGSQCFTYCLNYSFTSMCALFSGRQKIEMS